MDRLDSMIRQLLGDIRLDTNNTVMLREQLTSVRNQAIEIQFPEYKARDYIPLKRETNTGAEFVEFQILERQGRSKIVADYAKDFPRIGLVGTSHIGKIKSLGASYGFSVQEMRNAAFAGVPLSARLATAAKQAMIAEENQIAWFGNQANRIYGVFDNPNIPRALAPAGVGGIAWELKTPNEIIADMNQIVNGVSTNSLGVFSANVLLLPLSAYNLITSTPRSAVSDTTIYDWFLRNNPYIQKIDALNELEGASTTGNRMAMAYKLDRNVLELDVPQDFEIFPEQTEGMEMKYPCHSRIAGVHIYQPLAVNFLEDF
jgi:hypothetical protein